MHPAKILGVSPPTATPEIPVDNAAAARVGRRLRLGIPYYYYEIMMNARAALERRRQD